MKSNAATAAMLGHGSVRQCSQLRQESRALAVTHESLTLSPTAGAAVSNNAIATGTGTEFKIEIGGVPPDAIDTTKRLLQQVESYLAVVPLVLL